ncbi:PilZ domain-containing protein [Phenylobacterium sp.]|jgi:hypothetical protein|uniref:PilZ domain-containing protein n=1 Tax=Phenylobacterium sp. TaxID=1871053 RepID=UPI002E2FD723|nr:PilZ domain-containing protein [Phenylobacterium sp.]HEX2562071.1 PilZ domain-containing protein [Phenylobacterium sp.]
MSTPRAPTLETAAKAGSAEHRRAPRRDVSVAGLLLHGRSTQAEPCTIRDVSATGARVKLKSAQLLSRPIYLLIAKTGAAFEADIAWCRDAEIGLSFKARLNLADPRSDIERTAARLWQAMPKR